LQKEQDEILNGVAQPVDFY